MSEEFLYSQVEGLVGKVETIRPSSLLNRRRLYTTQNWIDLNKLKGALQGQIDDNSLPSGWVSLDKKGRTIYIVGDGNHRIGLACIYQLEVPFRVIGLWTEQRPIYDFSIIVKKIRAENIGLSK